MGRYQGHLDRGELIVPINVGNSLGHDIRVSVAAKFRDRGGHRQETDASSGRETKEKTVTKQDQTPGPLPAGAAREADPRDLVYAMYVPAPALKPDWRPPPTPEEITEGEYRR
jgi:hypothetical protein